MAPGTLIEIKMNALYAAADNTWWSRVSYGAKMQKQKY
jgi:hypothetical protein